MEAGIEFQRIPMDPELYKAADKGDINLLRNLLAAEGEQHLQQVVQAQDEGQMLPAATSVADAGDNALGRPINSLLGVTKGGDTVLHIAAYFGHLEVARMIFARLKFLLLRGNNKSETPLHYAAQAGKNEIVEEFIQVAKTAIRIQNIIQQEGVYDLKEILRRPEDVDVVKELLSRTEGVDVLKDLLRRRNQDGETALYQAVNNKHSAVVQTLIDEDLQLASILDNNNVSPLYLAVMQNSTDIFTKLIENFNGDLSQKAYAGPRGQTALHVAALRKGTFVQSILEKRPELASVIDDTSSTPLHFAAAHNNVEAVKVLLETDKSSAYIADSSGLYPVHVAAKMGHLEVVIQLFELCPDSDDLLDAQGRNFFHIAAEKENVRVARWVCSNSRLVRAMNAKDYRGNTPMHVAVKAKSLLIVLRLIQTKKAPIGVMNKRGLTPLDLAKAQLTFGLSIWRNSEYVIFLVLATIGSCGDIHRQDLYKEEYKLEDDQEIMKKEADNYENIAKNMSIGSVLIASASFAGAFAVSKDYKTDVSPRLSRAFDAYIIMVVYAFICSITATALLMPATLSFIDQKRRERNIIVCITLVITAIRALITAFAVGVYITLNRVSNWLGIVVCITGITVSLSADSDILPKIGVAELLLRSVGWRKLIKRILSTILPMFPRQIRENIFWEIFIFFCNYTLYLTTIYFVMFGN